MGSLPGAARGLGFWVTRERARVAPARSRDGARLGRCHDSCATGGMTQKPNPRAATLPHHRLIAYGVAVELLLAVKAANIRDAKLRDEAVRAAKGTCLNCAEAAGRVSRADKARVFAIARGEAVEAIAAVEIAAHAGDTTSAAAEQCVLIGERLLALLTALTR